MNDAAAPSAAGRLQAWLELFRLPNIFTAVADVTMAFLVTHAALRPAAEFVWLLLASCCLYTAGMVLNDVFDVEVDAQERPERPIPSGRIPLALARMVGLELLVVGTACGWTAAWWSGQVRPGLVASALAACVLAYDAWLKKTPLGPVAMGGCRALNVLLGMSTATFALDGGYLLIATGIGLYVVGVTWFARTEARESSRLQLALATLVMLGGIGLLAFFPAYTARVAAPPRWDFFWTVIAILIGWRCVRAVVTPQPALVQAAVKQSILSLILLDAAVVFAVHRFDGPGIPWMILVLLLLLPTMALGRWIYST